MWIIYICYIHILYKSCIYKYINKHINFHDVRTVFSCETMFRVAWMCDSPGLQRQFVQKLPTGGRVEVQ